MSVKNLAVCLLAFTSFNLAADNGSGKVFYEENKGQWQPQIAFRADLPAGSVFLEKNKLLFTSYRLQDVQDVHEALHDAGSAAERQLALQKQIQCHAWAVNFEGAAKQAWFEGVNPQQAYSNYFLGNDPLHWASHVGRYEYVLGHSVYENIDFKAYGEGHWFKYDFVVHPGGNPAHIKLRYEGTEIKLQKDGTLLLKLSTGLMMEKKPVAWQVIQGRQVPVKCRYTLNGNLLQFDFPDGYNPAFELVIDPTLAGATYSGSFVGTFGHAAAPDNQGNVFTGGKAFGIGYPATTGAFSITFAGGTDIVISKYNNNTSALIYATYLGGSMGEEPHSLLCSATGDLFILGISESGNYPVTSGAFDNSLNGQNDFVISQLDANGSVLIASTYVGGTNQDGLGLMNETGDISLTAAGNLIVTGTTSSINFPVTAGAFQQIPGGNDDAVLFCLSPGFGTLVFSTYLGGSGNDSGSDNAIDPVSGDIIVCGGTTSSNFPLQQAYQPVFSGVRDGFITRFNSTGSGLVASTYYGTTGIDVCLFTDTDAGGNVYVYGNADGAGGIPVTAGVYSNPNSPTFISKFDVLMQTVMFSTQIGTGNITDVPMLTAFRINECENIFIAGFFGPTTVTANALYNSANSPGSSYIAVLAKDAVSLAHATYFGGNHIEPAKCRFDDLGTIYHSTCQDPSPFPVSPGAYATSNTTGGYDVCAFKISFPPAGVTALASVLPSATGCAPFNASFVNNSNGVNYYWDFGDGSPVDTNAAPAHTYIQPGVYTVTLIAEDSSACVVRDTTTLTITVLQPPLVALGNDTLFCGNFPPQLLDAGNPGLTYTWSTGATTQTITASTPGLYWVTTDNGSCTHTDSILLSQIPPPAPIPDTAVCAGQTYTLNAGAGQTWLWNTGATTQSISVTSSGNYSVIITISSCTFHDTASVIFNPVPVVDLGNDTFFCTPQTLTLDAGNSGTQWLWSTGAVTQQILVNGAGSYAVTVTALNCEASDTILITVAPQPELGMPQSICSSTQLTLSAGNFPPGTAFLWNTGATTPSITVTEAGTYHVSVTYQSCVLTDSVEITGTPGEGTLYIPNAFTPNGDGINDVFLASANEISDFHLIIFNRWGQLVFETYSLNEGWNGSFNNETVQQDTYVVIVTYRTPCHHNTFERKTAHLNVIR
ncbi:MAG: gliding motility-associated C-terminal domain-containing protein [Bacteroidia bacterium]|jgi:gliding motility-associated-like protein|nr:gliding motility-associated C-terminal domain-containing protein [Bacteroidia bacterium]